MSTYALAYERVSTEEQADSNNSIPAQRRRIEEYAAKNGITILGHYTDAGASAFKDDENRAAFWQMIERAKRDQHISLILVDDATRFYRNKARAVMVKADLRAHGVQVRSVSMPYDPNTLHGLWLEGIDEIRAQAGSMETGFATFRGMQQNIATRDPSTGWCYKNGGKAPYGYEAYHVVVGKDTRGKEIERLLWRINEHEADVVRFVLLTLRAEQELSYDDIRDELNRRSIPGPRRGLWSTSCIYEFCREERVLQYAGIAYWNKQDHRTKGVRFKPKDQWVKVENAHPAIITMEEAERVLAVNRRRHKNRAKLWVEKLNYMLSGDNLFGEPLFRCKRCGGRMIGQNRNPRYARRKYVCSTAVNKGPHGCVWKGVPVDLLESEIVKRITAMLADDELERYAADLRGVIEDERRDIVRSQKQATGRLREIEQEMNNLLNAVGKGLDSEVVIQRVNTLKEEQTTLERSLAELGQIVADLRTSLDKLQITRDDVLAALHGDDIKAKREYMKRVILQMEYDPDVDTVTVHLLPGLTSIINISPEAARLLRFGDGAEGRVWVLKRSRDAWV